jgi:glutamate-1-semialdehyde 2,1-aminomutase
VTFFGLNEEAVQLARMVTDAVACAEKIRFANNGTEAAMFAIRALRTYRRRDKILKFECSFHGNADFAAHNLTSTAPYPQAVPDSAGIPAAASADVIIAPFNDLETTAGIIAAHADELAAVVCEPFQRVVAPDPAFLRGVRDLTRQHGVPLLFDEIVTGFRFAYGGAQEVYGVVPDMCLLSKVPTGGLPLGIIAGSAELMGVFDSANFGSDYGSPGRAGVEENLKWTLPMVSTYMANPLSCAAGIATLEVLQELGEEGYRATHVRGERLQQGLQQALDEAGLVGSVLGHPTCFDVLFGIPSVEVGQRLSEDRSLISRLTPAETIKIDKPTMLRFNQLLLQRGVYKADMKYYISTAHTDEDIEEAIRVFREAAAVLANEMA